MQTKAIRTTTVLFKPGEGAPTVDLQKYVGIDYAPKLKIVQEISFVGATIIYNSSLSMVIVIATCGLV
jgi:hypothetical protein